MSWEMKPLGEILEQSGQHRAGERDFPVLSITMKQGLVDQADKFNKRVASQDTSNYKIAYKNELVVGFPIDEGVLGFQTKYPAGIVSPAYDIWKLKDEANCHIPYLELYLRSQQARRLYASRMQGAVARRRSLTKADFLKLEIPFPPLDDQKRIAYLVSNIENLIARRKHHLQQLDDLIKSVFLEMFGDPVRNEKGWPSKYLESFIDQERGISYGIVQRGDHFPGGVPVLRIRDIISEEYIESELVRTALVNSEKYTRTILHGGELLLSIRGTVGALSIAPPHAIGWNVSRELAVIPVEHGIKVKYLVHLLKSPPMQRQFATMIKGVAQSGLNLSEIRKIEIILPPEENQIAFERIAAKIESLIASYKNSLIDLMALYGSLSHMAFKGELNLSRVPVTLEQEESTEEIETEIDTVTETTVKPAIELPRPPTIDDLCDAKGRMEVIGFWLDSYLDQLGGMSFDAQDFMERAQQKLWELLEDDAYQLSVTEYDHIKDLIFKYIEAGRLAQCYDDDKNLVQITAARG